MIYIYMQINLLMPWLNVQEFFLNGFNPFQINDRLFVPKFLVLERGSTIITYAYDLHRIINGLIIAKN